MLLQCRFASNRVEKLHCTPPIILQGQVPVLWWQKAYYLHFTYSLSCLTRYSSYLSPFWSTSCPQLTCHSVVFPMPNTKRTLKDGRELSETGTSYTMAKANSIHTQLFNAPQEQNSRAVDTNIYKTDIWLFKVALQELLLYCIEEAAHHNASFHWPLGESPA